MKQRALRFEEGRSDVTGKKKAKVSRNDYPIKSLPLQCTYVAFLVYTFSLMGTFESKGKK